MDRNKETMGYMKVYLQRHSSPEARELVHGVDYTKGLEDGRECGVKHEFVTRGCKPVFFTEEDVERFDNKEDFVEIVPSHRTTDEVEVFTSVQEPDEYGDKAPMP